MPPVLNLKEIAEKSGITVGPRSVFRQGPVQQTDTTTPFTTTASNEPAIISSSQGASIVDKNTQRLRELKGTLPEPEKVTTVNGTDTTKTETGSLAIGRPEDTKPDKTKEDYVTYINPETGAEKTLRGDAISDSTRQKLEQGGWQVSDESTSRTTSTSTADVQRKKAENELNSALSQLQSTAVTSRELQSTISDIKSRFSVRIQQMEEINRRREQTLNTLGVRLGSRYTGGSGGVFGGILAEEERQGVSRIAAIESEMQSAIRNAEKAAKEHNYSVFVQLTQKAQEKYDQKLKAFEDLKKTQEEQDKKVKEEANTVANQSAVIEQIQAGITSPVEIFTALGGTVPFDVIKELTDTMPSSNTEQFTLGRYDIRYDSTGRVIARGMAGGGGDVSLSIGSNGGYIPTGSGGTGKPVISGLGTTYANSSPQVQFTIERIFNGLPTQLKNNVAEHPLWKNSILNYLKNGYDEQQIKDELSGFALFDKADKSLGYTFYNLSTGTDIAPEELAGLINRGDTDGAMALVENKKLEKVNSFFANTDKARGTVKQADAVLSILNDPKFPKDALGAFDGRVFRLARQVTPQQQVKIQQLESALDLLNAPIRIEIVGTAGTASEMEKITGFQAEILDQPEIVKSKVQDLRDSVLRFHNEARSQRNLPQVSRDQLVDNKKRLELYRQIGQAEKEVTNSQMTNADFLSSGFWGGNEPAKQNTDNNKTFFQGLGGSQ